jgi:hypothetical protein
MQAVNGAQKGISAKSGSAVQVFALNVMEHRLRLLIL